MMKSGSDSISISDAAVSAIDDAFQRYWHQTLLWKYFPYFMSCITLLWFLEKLLSFGFTDDTIESGTNSISIEWTQKNIIIAIIAPSILTVLPFIQSEHYKIITSTFTGALLIYCVISLESLFGRHQCLTTYYSMVIFFRVLHFRTFFDNFSLCVAFSSNIGCITRGSSIWYMSANLTVWSYFILALLFDNIHRRVAQRNWEHLRALIIIKEKTNLQKSAGNAATSSHMSPDILEHLFPSKFSSKEAPFLASQSETNSSLSMRSGSCFIQQIESVREDQIPPDRKKDATILDEAIRLGIVTDFDPGVLSVSELKSIRGVDKRSVSLVGVLVDYGTAKDCALAVDRERKVHKLLEIYAKKYNLTSVRTFGNVWLGVGGYFKKCTPDLGNPSPNNNSNSGSNEVDLNIIMTYKILLFCCDVEAAARILGIRVAMAMDFGSIVGGFINSPKFNIFGQEIRWLLRMMDLHDFGKIIISDNVRHNLTAFKKQHPEILSALIERRAVEYPWKKDFVAQVTSIMNSTELIQHHTVSIKSVSKLLQDQDCEDFEVFDNGIWKLRFESRRDVLSPDISLQMSLNKSSYDSSTSLLSPLPNNETATTSSLLTFIWNSMILHGGLPSSEKEHSERDKFLDDDYWGENISSEFKKELPERLHGIQVNDHTLKNFSAEDLEDLEGTLERRIDALVHKLCFSNIFYLITMYSWFQETNDSNEESDDLDSIVSSTSSSSVANYISPKQLYFSKEWLFSALKELRIWLSYFSLGQLLLRFVGLFITIDGGDPSKIYIQPSHGSDDECMTVERSSEPETTNQKASHQREETGSSDHSSESSYKIKKRAWPKYLSDCRRFFFHALPNFLAQNFFMLVSFLSTIAVLSASEYTFQDELFMDLLIIHFIFLQTIQKSWGRAGDIIQWILRIAIVCLFPNFSTDASAPSADSAGSPRYGDLGGDVSLSIFLLMCIPSYIHQSLLLTVIDLISLRAILLFRQALDVSFHLSQAAAIEVIFPALLIMAYMYAINYRCFISYMIEHKILPLSWQQYKRQLDNTDSITSIFCPNLPLEIRRTPGKLTLHKNAILVSVHLKAIDIISSLLDCRDVARLTIAIGQVITRTFQDFDMLHIGDFSGVYVAVTGSQLVTQGKNRVSKSSSYTTQVLYLVSAIQARIDRFSRDNNFNVSLGISLNAGRVYIGFLGCKRFNFDIAGSARDMGVAFASHNNEGLFTSSAFEGDIQKIKPPDDLVHHQNILDLSGESYWLRVDGTFAGLQLEDFTYICMLGRGGYGSVHLVSEKYSKNRYAVKVITLKQGSLLSKMIKRECIILEKMCHPNVVTLKCSFVHSNRLFLVMSYIKGGNLKQVIDGGAVELSQLRYWFAQLVLAIEYIHSVGIIHRDIKPANCMIGCEGQLKLADFGLSRIDKSGRENRNPESVKEGSTKVDSVGLGNSVYLKLRKFLPLKLRATDSVPANIHRSLSVLVIKNDAIFTGKRGEIPFSNFSVRITSAKTKSEADTLINLNSIDAIFIELTQSPSSSSSSSSSSEASELNDRKELIKYFCSSLLNTVPIYVLGAPGELSEELRSCGAKDSFSGAQIEKIEESDWRKIFPAIPDNEDISEQEYDERERTEQQMLHMTSLPELTPPSQSAMSSTGNDPTITGTGNIARTGNHNSFSRNDSFANSKSGERDHIVGTMHFIAPEVIKKNCKYGKAVDWWACGLTFYYCVLRHHLFAGDNKETVFNNILNERIDLSSLEEFGDSIKSLIEGLVCRDVSQRLGSQGTERIREHPFFESIDWFSVSESNSTYKPGQFLPKKFDIRDKMLFYGESEHTHQSLSSSHREMEMRSLYSLQRHDQNRQRLRCVKKFTDVASKRMGTSFLFNAKLKKLISGQAKPKERATHSSSHADSAENGSSASNLFANVALIEVENENEEDDEAAALKMLSGAARYDNSVLGQSMENENSDMVMSFCEKQQFSEEFAAATAEGTDRDRDRDRDRANSGPVEMMSFQSAGENSII